MPLNLAESFRRSGDFPHSMHRTTEDRGQRWCYFCYLETAYDPVKIDKPIEELPVLEDDDRSGRTHIFSAGRL